MPPPVVGGGFFARCAAVLLSVLEYGGLRPLACLQP